MCKQTMYKHILLLNLFLSLILCTAQADSIGDITVTIHKEEVITSYITEKYKKEETLTLNVDASNVQWSLVPENSQIDLKDNKVTVHTNNVLPKTTFTIMASNQKGTSSLEFDIAVNGCPYGSFTRFQTKSSGIKEFVISHNSEVVYKDKITDTYICLDHSSYTFTFDGEFQSYLTISDENGAHYYTTLFGSNEHIEDTFENIPTNSPALHLPSFIYLNSNSPKDVFLEFSGAIQEISFKPDISYNFLNSTMSFSSCSESQNEYTITAKNGEQQVSSILHVYCNHCPPNTIPVNTFVQSSVSYSIPSLESKMIYASNSSFCLADGVYDAKFYGNKLTWNTLFYMETGNSRIYEFVPESEKQYYYDFKIDLKHLINTDDDFKYLVGKPNRHWSELDFNEKNWKEGKSNQWGNYDSTNMAYFRKHVMINTESDDYKIIMYLKGEGHATIIINNYYQINIQLSDHQSQTVLPSSYFTQGHNIIAIQLTNQGQAQTKIEFTCSSIFINSSQLLVSLGGKVSSVQTYVDPEHPPQDAFTEQHNANWASTFPSELIYSFENSQQIVNEIQLSEPVCTHHYGIQIFGETPSSQVLLSELNQNTFVEHPAFGLTTISFLNLQPFNSYRFVLSGPFNETISLSHIHFYLNNLKSCPKKYGLEHALEGTRITKSCRLGYSGIKIITCEHKINETETNWYESDSYCVPTNPESKLEYIDWEFTIDDMTMSRWNKESDKMTQLLVEHTYLRVSDIEYIYSHVDIQHTISTLHVFCRCTVDTLFGELIKRDLQRLQPKFSEAVSKKFGKYCKGEISNITLHRHVNWALVITLSIIVVVITTFGVIYWKIRGKKTSGMRLLKKSSKKVEEQALIV